MGSKEKWAKILDLVKFSKLTSGYIEGNLVSENSAMEKVIKKEIRTKILFFLLTYCLLTKLYGWLKAVLGPST